MRGLSCRLFPFLPRSPHLLGTASSCSPPLIIPWPVRSRRWTAGVLFDDPPRIAATEECAQRACFRMAEVTVIHSVTTSATGFTATVMGRGSRVAGALWLRVAASTSLPSLDMVALYVFSIVWRDKGAVGANVYVGVVGWDIATCPFRKREREHASLVARLPGCERRNMQCRGLQKPGLDTSSERSRHRCCEAQLEVHLTWIEAHTPSGARRSQGSPQRPGCPR